MPLKPLSDQIIVITGATSGNGLATARLAVARGARVVLVARNADALEAVRAELGAGAATYVADVGETGAGERIAAAATAAFGGFDSWVNNAAVGTYGTLAQVPEADHRRVFDVNYFGVLSCALAAADHLRRAGRGAIVNVGSILSDRAIVQQGPYSASKFALAAMTRTLRMELAGSGVSVTLVKPGAIHTPFAEHARNYMDAPPRLPPPLYDPSVVAEAVLFACAHPRRTLYAGGGGWIASALARTLPAVTDRIMEVAGTRVQQTAGDPGDPARRDNLYEPRRDGAAQGSQPLHARRTSIALRAQMLPGALWWAAAAVAAGAVVAVAGRGGGAVGRARRSSTITAGARP